VPLCLPENRGRQTSRGSKALTQMGMRLMGTKADGSFRGSGVVAPPPAGEGMVSVLGLNKRVGGRNNVTFAHMNTDRGR